MEKVKITIKCDGKNCKEKIVVRDHNVLDTVAKILPALVDSEFKYDISNNKHYCKGCYAKRTATN